MKKEIQYIDKMVNSRQALCKLLISIIYTLNQLTQSSSDIYDQNHINKFRL